MDRGWEITIFFGLIKIEEWDSRYESSFLRSYFTKKQWEADGYYEKEPGGGLYYDPHLIIKMSGGESISKSFKSVNSMECWIAENLQGVNLIKIIE
jgi:hypothetical protein